MAIDWGKVAAIGVPAGVGAASMLMAQRNRNQDKEDAEAARDEDRADRRETNTLDLASRESLADPFRHQNAQVSSLAMLDRIANAQRGKTQISVPSEMQRFVPQISGGYSYEASPDLRTAAKLTQRSVASGQGAPTMTDPANYGRTGANNLNDPNSIGMGARPTPGGAGGAMPMPGVGGAVPRTGATAPAPGTMSSSFFTGGADAGSPSYSTDKRDMEMNAASGNPAYTNYRRRREGAGGVLGGAIKGAGAGALYTGPMAWAGAPVGAVIGGIAGAFTKNAKSAMSDFYLDDAKAILRDETERMWGEPATEEQIDEAIAGQGWEPGDEFVGQQGLDYILQQWAKRAQQQPADEEDEQFTPSYSGLFA